MKALPQNPSALGSVALNVFDLSVAPFPGSDILSSQFTGAVGLPFLGVVPPPAGSEPAVIKEPVDEHFTYWLELGVFVHRLEALSDQ